MVAVLIHPRVGGLVLSGKSSNHKILIFFSHFFFLLLLLSLATWLVSMNQAETKHLF